MIKIAVSAATVLAGGMVLAANLVPGTPSNTATAGASVTVVAAAQPAAAASTSTMPASQWLDCGKEEQTCTVTGPTLVRYGTGDRFVIKEVTGRFSCSNGVFGDPAWGSVKTCSVLTATPTDRWVSCASEWQTCVVPSSTMVRYGANGRFAFKETSTRIGCNNQVFGDPIRGTFKACAYRVAELVQLAKQVELSAIPSNFDKTKLLSASWGTGAIPGPEEGEGAFRFICEPSHNSYDDPIVFPGQPGKSHLHTFFGNTKADAYSTYASLRTTGDSTCNNLLNRSAYWIPAMMNGAGKVAMPDYVAIYYKGLPSSSPLCSKIGKACIALPRGLRYIFGHNMQDPAASSPSESMWWNCDAPSAPDGGGHFANIAQAARKCPIGSRLGMVMTGPSCWDGKQLDSADHHSHMAYTKQNGSGMGVCPATHPYVVPHFTIGAWYTTDATLDRSGDESPNAKTWYLASDRMAGMANAVPGTTMHSDWFGAWDDDIMAIWMTNCIEKMLSCSGGDLGNSKQMTQISGYKFRNITTLVDPPARK